MVRSSDKGLRPLSERHLSSWVWACDSNNCEGEVQKIEKGGVCVLSAQPE